MENRKSEKHFIQLIGFLSGLVLLVNTTRVDGGKPAVYNHENYYDEDKFTPEFLTLGQNFSIAIGSTVVLPCKINKTVNAAHYNLAWLRGSSVLTAASVKVNANSRIRLIELSDMQESHNSFQSSSYNLEITDVREVDAGSYVCQIGTIVPKETLHQLEILVPPRITSYNPKTLLIVNQGDSIRLECQASGNPHPKITWTRKNNNMFNGEPNITKDVLEIMHADRHSAGIYKCTADNRVGQPDVREIVVNVLHAPEIEVERPNVHTGVGIEAQLVCIVHAEPPPTIVWFKEGIQLGMTEVYSQQARGNRYSLVIRNVTHGDIGNYTCQARNDLGKDKAHLKLTGIPGVCVFDSPTLSNYRDQYNISWSVQSFAPIREYRLFYIKQTSHHLIQDTHSQHSYSQTSAVTFDQWENVVLPGSYPEITNFINHHHSKHKMHHLIRNLTPATNYLARIQARNEHGWNKLSSIFHFSTRAEDLEMEPSAQPAVFKNHDSGIDANSYSGGVTSTMTTTASNYYILTSLVVVAVSSVFGGCTSRNL